VLLAGDLHIGRRSTHLPVGVGGRAHTGAGFALWSTIHARSATLADMPENVQGTESSNGPSMLA